MAADFSGKTAIVTLADKDEPSAQAVCAEIVAAGGKMKKIMLKTGAEPALTSPQVFGPCIKTEIKKWRKMVKAANIRID